MRSLLACLLLMRTEDKKKKQGSKHWTPKTQRKQEALKELSLPSKRGCDDKKTKILARKTTLIFPTSAVDNPRMF
jgi:hypothetical protein